ncbi:MAG: hypothetical protein QM791_14510 [Ferruginibacter sp.]
MKKLIAVVFLTGLFVTGCKKREAGNLPENMERVPLPSVLRDATSDKFISPVDPASFHGKLNIGLFYPEDVKPQKFDVVVMKNGNASVVKTLKADVTSFPTSVEITGAQLADLFGAAIVEGDKFDVSVDITTNTGKKYPAFSTVGTAYGAGIPGAAGGISTGIQFVMLCKFNVDDYDGDFQVVTDQWQDYATGDIIHVSKVDENTVSFEYAAANPKPILVDIDPATNATSVALQEYGSYGGEAFSAKSAATPKDDDNVSPCEGTLSINLEHIGVESGSIGSFLIKLKKVE